MNLRFEQIFFHGDNHGDWGLLKLIIERLNLKDCLLIGVGDTGAGFAPYGERTYRREFGVLNKWFAERNIEYWSIRGNHCDPNYFDGSVDFSNFKLIPDYTKKTINGKKFLFVGGAISVDRYYRTEGRDYFSGEGFILKEDLVEKCDVLVTHTGPNCIGPSHLVGFCVPFFDKDPKLKQELGEERKKMDRLFELTRPKYWLLGHFHQSETKEENGCLYRILDINEIYLFNPQLV